MNSNSCKIWRQQMSCLDEKRGCNNIRDVFRWEDAFCNFWLPSSFHTSRGASYQWETDCTHNSIHFYCIFLQAPSLDGPIFDALLLVPGSQLISHLQWNPWFNCPISLQAGRDSLDRVYFLLYRKLHLFDLGVKYSWPHNSVINF